jgi:hypothetical protein
MSSISHSLKKVFLPTVRRLDAFGVPRSPWRGENRPQENYPPWRYDHSPMKPQRHERHHIAMHGTDVDDNRVSPV